MPRVVSKAYVEALKDPGARPPFALQPEDDNAEQIAAAQATNQAILALTAAVGQLCSGVVAAMPKGTDPALLEAVDRVAAGQAALLEAIRNQKQAPQIAYRFKIVRNEYGDLDHVDAIPGELP